MRSLYTLLILFCSFYSEAKAQSNESNVFSLHGQAEYGFLIGHHPEMQRLSTRHFPSFKLFLGHKTTGKELWHQQNNFPELGVGVYFSPLMFNDELGQAYAVFGYFERKYGKKDRNNFSFRFGLGPGFLSSKFDPEDNNYNIAIGTNINIFVFFEFQKEFKITKALDLKIGVGAAHFSNTGIQMPNLGINLASAQIGLKYRIGIQTLDTTMIAFPKKHSWTHEVVVSYGVLQTQTEKAKTNIINTRYQAAFSFTYKSSVVGSADLFFNIAGPYEFESQAIDSYFQAGIAAGYLLNLDRFQASLQWGFYLYNNNNDFSAYYHRLGLKWIATEHFLVNLSLRTEWARARNVEFGIGWRF